MELFKFGNMVDRWLQPKFIPQVGLVSLLHHRKRLLVPILCNARSYRSTNCLVRANWKRVQVINKLKMKNIPKASRQFLDHSRDQLSNQLLPQYLNYLNTGLGFSRMDVVDKSLELKRMISFSYLFLKYCSIYKILEIFVLLSSKNMLLKPINKSSFQTYLPEPWSALVARTSENPIASSSLRKFLFTSGTAIFRLREPN